jgi:acetyl-CoA C-acetyltransferase
MARVNVNGGAITLAPRWQHGSRLITTALHELEGSDQNTGADQDVR